MGFSSWSGSIDISYKELKKHSLGHAFFSEYLALVGVLVYDITKVTIYYVRWTHGLT